MIKKTTLKTCCIIFLFAAFSIPALAQDNAGQYPKSVRFALAGQGFIEYPNRLGASLDGKLMLRGKANKDVFNEFVVTAKAAHCFANSSGDMFQAFDKGQYDNVSGLFLLAGYRINFGLPLPYNKDIDAIGGFFIELNAGLSYVHHINPYYKRQLSEEGQHIDEAKLRTWAPAISGVAGYTASKRLDVILSYTGAWPLHTTGKTKQSFIGTGLQYNF